MDALSRQFLYLQNTEVYSVTFGITESDVRPEFLIRTYRFFRNPVVADVGSLKGVAATIAKRAARAVRDPRPVGYGIRFLSQLLRRASGHR